MEQNGMRISVVQMNSRGDKAANIAEAVRLIKEAALSAPEVIALPEYFACLSDIPTDMHLSAEELPQSGEASDNGASVHATLSALARELGVAIHAGSICEKQGNSFFNTTIVFGPDGADIARYRKIHLFDVDVPGGASYRESDSVARGDAITTYKVGDVTVGCGICYDLRFPEMFRALRDKGADLIVLPAAFTLLTGKDHWEVLLRARAIETQCYIAAPAQIFTHGDNKACFGHSMIVDPWGQVTAMVPDEVGVATATIDLKRLNSVRTKLPVAQHHVLN
jgi:deaminated glutathione amidase